MESTVTAAAIRAHPTTRRALVAAMSAAEHAAASSAPVTPEGHGSRAAGALAKPSAAHAMGHAGMLATQAREGPSPGTATEVTTPSRPRTVVAAAQGRATRFAGTA
jgi:hypothetical protein